MGPEVARRALLSSQLDVGTAIMMALNGVDLERPTYQDRSIAEQLLAGRSIDVDNMSYEELLALGDTIGTVDVGLDKDQLLDACDVKRLCSLDMQSFEYEETDKFDMRCCVCLCEYAKGEELAKLSCGHQFHLNCLSTWLQNSKKCPLCLQDVDQHNRATRNAVRSMQQAA